MTVVPLTEELVRAVAEQMRASDRAEIGALSPGGQVAPAALAAECARSRWGAVVLHEGRPAVAFGMIPAWPGAASCWMFATDAWASCWRSAVRGMRDTLAAAMPGLNCAFVFADAGRPDVARLLTGIGFIRRGIVPRFGAGGESFALWSRTGGAR